VLCAGDDASIVASAANRPVDIGSVLLGMTDAHSSTVGIGGSDLRYARTISDNA
jgi:hypothetical protein